MEFDIFEYFAQEDIEDMFRTEIRLSIRKQLENDEELEKLISSLAYQETKLMVEEIWGENLNECVTEIIARDLPSMIRFQAFRRKDPWTEIEGPAVKILEEECANSRPLIKKSIENEIKNYPFYEIKEEIEDVIISVVRERLFYCEGGDAN